VIACAQLVARIDPRAGSLRHVHYVSVYVRFAHVHTLDHHCICTRMGHNAGIPIDSVLTIVDRRTGRVAAKLYQGGNCKTETCYVNEGLWMHPNADFVPVYTEKEFLILKQCV
jgi:hypothetical protein